MDKDIKRILLETAGKSLCNKRKVGAIIATKHDIFATGFNHTISGKPCEDSHGNTVDEVIHAEIDCLNNYDGKTKGAKMYVTHPPCINCAQAIKEAGLKYEVIQDFLKFDKDKLRYDLIPVEWGLNLASVLTHGAKKYKPNNWRQVDDIDRYVGAAFRHLEAWRAGEHLDKDSGLPHLAHVMTNIGFLLSLDRP